MHELPTVSRAQDVLRGFVPTRRFARVSFDSYQPDPRYASQERAQRRMRQLAYELAPRRGIARFWRRRHTPRGIYLDGGYGVGKTHLLAATYHAVAGQRFYLSFAELAYTISRLGLQAALLAFTQARLICIDEFELDDVAQTRMASSFLKRLLERPDTHVVTTSNTLPSDLGRGRFAAEAFQRDIGDIASAFEVVTIDGEDYRHRHWDELERPRTVEPAELGDRYAADGGPNKLRIPWAHLAAQLERVHPVHYGQIAANLDALFVSYLTCIQDQAVALRLVHLVDKLYDQEVGVTISTNGRLALNDVFSESYRHGGYEKKYRRCLSRLHELLSETDAAIRSPHPTSAPTAPPARYPDAPHSDPAPAD
jgi:cell division protein ZapE